MTAPRTPAQQVFELENRVITLETAMWDVMEDVVEEVAVNGLDRIGVISCDLMLCGKLRRYQQLLVDVIEAVAGWQERPVEDVELPQ